MNKKQIYYYNLHLIKRKEPIYLNQVQGEKLAMLLTKSNPPKFVLIDDNVIATSSISLLERQISKKTELSKDKMLPREVSEKRELTEEEKQIRQQYLEHKKSLVKKFQMPDSIKQPAIIEASRKERKLKNNYDTNLG